MIVTSCQLTGSIILFVSFLAINGFVLPENGTSLTDSDKSLNDDTQNVIKDEVLISTEVQVAFKNATENQTNVMISSTKVTTTTPSAEVFEKQEIGTIDELNINPVNIEIRELENGETLENNIRNTVKDETSIGTAFGISVIEDIPEPEIREIVAENILVALNPTKEFPVETVRELNNDNEHLMDTTMQVSSTTEILTSPLQPVENRDNIEEITTEMPLVLTTPKIMKTENDDSPLSKTEMRTTTTERITEASTVTILETTLSQSSIVETMTEMRQSRGLDKNLPQIELSQESSANKTIDIESKQKDERLEFESSKIVNNSEKDSIEMKNELETDRVMIENEIKIESTKRHENDEIELKFNSIEVNNSDDDVVEDNVEVGKVATQNLLEKVNIEDKYEVKDAEEKNLNLDVKIPIEDDLTKEEYIMNLENPTTVTSYKVVEENMSQKTADETNSNKITNDITRKQEDMRINYTEQKLLAALLEHTTFATMQIGNEENVNFDESTIIIPETVTDNIDSSASGSEFVENASENAHTNKTEEQLIIMKDLNADVSDDENAAVETVTVSNQQTTLIQLLNNISLPIDSEKSSESSQSISEKSNESKESKETITTQQSIDQPTTISVQQVNYDFTTEIVTEETLGTTMKILDNDSEEGTSSSKKDSSEESNSSDSSEEKKSKKSKKHKDKKSKMNSSSIEKNQDSNEDSKENSSSEITFKSEKKAHGRSLDTTELPLIGINEAATENRINLYNDNDHNIMKKSGIEDNIILTDLNDDHFQNLIPINDNSVSKKVLIPIEPIPSLPQLTFRTTTLLPLKVFKTDKSVSKDEQRGSVTDNVIDILEKETVTSVLAETLFEAAELTTEVNRHISSFRTIMETDIEIPSEINETSSLTKDDIMAISDIGNALPNYDLRASSNTTIVVLIVTTSIILIIGVLAITFLKFRGKHGTLDIQMEEQRHGKNTNYDDDNDIDDDTNETNSNCNESTSITQSIHSSQDEAIKSLPSNQVSLLSHEHKTSD